MPEKECTVCHKFKPIDSFNKDKLGLYGRKSLCRNCQSARDKKYRDDPVNQDKIRVYRKAIADRYTGRYTGKYEGRYKETYAKAVSRWFQNTPNARKAHKAVERAVSEGKLPKVKTSLCQQCGNPARHYHHHNGYDKDHWLDVIPLCVKCHRNTHVNT